MSNSIELVISDIDGTIITSNHEVTGATIEAAASLNRRDIMLSLASSRPARSIRPIAETLQLRSPFAAFNGAVIATAEGLVVASYLISPETTKRIKEIADYFALNVWLYDERDWWAPLYDSFVEREAHTSGFEPKLDGYAERLNDRFNKLTVVGKPDLIAQAERQVLAELSNEVSASRSKPRFLDVTPRGIHKGSAVAHLSELLCVPASAIAVIGDGPNDVEMFKQAAVSIAMGQAVDEVRAAAKYVTSSNDYEGWAHGINKYVLGLD